MNFNFWLLAPGYRWLKEYWQSFSDDECKHLGFIANGPELPFTVVLALYSLCKFIIPAIIKKRGKPFDTRPLEIVFHGFFFGIFGIALLVGFYVFHGFTVFLSCERMYLHPFFSPLRSYFAVMGIVLVHIYSIHFLLVALNGRKMSNIHLFYHALSLIFSTFGANYQPDENVCLYVVLEINFLAVYSMLQVLNAASPEVKGPLVNLRTKLYLRYLNFRRYQYGFLFIHAMLHLFTSCTMKKELAFIELMVTIAFSQFQRKEIRDQVELEYCNDSYLKANKEIGEENQLAEKKVD